MPYHAVEKRHLFHQFQYDEFRHHHIGHRSIIFSASDAKTDPETVKSTIKLVLGKQVIHGPLDHLLTISVKHLMWPSSFMLDLWVPVTHHQFGLSILWKSYIRSSDFGNFFSHCIDMERYRKAEEDTTCSKTWLEVLFVQTIASCSLFCKRLYFTHKWSLIIDLWRE